MTPYEIEIMLHYYCRGDDHPVTTYPHGRTIQSLVDRGLIEQTTNGSMLPNRTYQLTERGEAYVKALLAVPLPMQVWVMPETPKEPKP